jgi:Na+(H+)/acetate symporter ActP
MGNPDDTVWPAVLSVACVCRGDRRHRLAGVAAVPDDVRLLRRQPGGDTRWNASAIPGEYLSAASFLGVAGLVLAFGADVLWYPVGYTAGYLVLLALVAAPLRRSGAYTLPDFAQLRLDSLAVRRLAALLVVGIGWLYLLPQFRGAGLALRTASTFCPLLVLGIWWRGLTTAGAIAGLLTRGVLAIAAVLATIVGGSFGGWAGALLAQPAAWTMPAAFAVMVVASLLTRSSAPRSAGRVLARLHAPETQGLGR